MISLEEYFDNLFKTSCGWLGWEPEVVLTTNIGQLELALEGKVDFVKKTNPFGSGEESEEEKLRKAIPDPENAAKQLIEMVKRRQMADERSRPIKRNE